MTNVSKLAGLLLIPVLILSSLTMFGSAFAQSTSEPSVPDFTAKAFTTIIEVTIKNQPLTSYENGSFPSLYYGFRLKDHNISNGFWDYEPPYFVLPSTYGSYYKASYSDFTVVSLSIEGYHFPSGQIDIQALALVGNQYPTNMQNGTVYGFEGIISGWSNTQTLTIDKNLFPSAESDIFQIAIVIGILVIVIAGISVLVYFKKRRH